MPDLDLTVPDQAAIVAYITARLDEDEATALAARVGPVDDGRWEAHDVNGRVEGGGRMVAGTGIAIDERNLDGGQADHIAGWDPATVLADVAAKRRIIARHAGVHICPDPQDQGNVWYIAGERVVLTWPCGDLLDLAQPFAARDDFPTEWKINA